MFSDDPYDSDDSDYSSCSEVAYDSKIEEINKLIEKLNNKINSCEFIDKSNKENCSICYNYFCKERYKIIFKCSHYVCSLCIEVMKINDIFKCPECRENIKNFICNYNDKLYDKYRKEELDSREEQLKIKNDDFTKKEIRIKNEMVSLKKKKIILLKKEKNITQKSNELEKQIFDNIYNILDKLDELEKAQLIKKLFEEYNAIRNKYHFGLF